MKNLKYQFVSIVIFYCGITDGCQAVKEEWAPSVRARRNDEDDFDQLLQKARRKIKK